MYDCLTAQEESQLFLAAMDEYAKSLDADAVDNDDDDAPLAVLPHNVYTESEVKNDTTTNNNGSQPIFFIAGRGGETNFHAGNAIFRDRVLQYTQTYIAAGTKGRGKKFAKSLMKDCAITQGVIFVVRQSYFRKNVQAGKISAARKNSVLQEHAPRTLQDLLHKEESSHYLSIGMDSDWVVGIITDLLRTSASKVMAAASSPKQPQQQQVSVVCSKRKRAPPCPEISIPHQPSTPQYHYQQQQQPQYQYQQQQQQQQQQRYPLFQHHEDCSLSSVSDDEDYSLGMDNSSRGSASAMSASNDMFLSSYPQQPEMQQQQTMPLHKRARRIMTVATTTIPSSSAPTAPVYNNLPENQSQCWWPSAVNQQQQFYGYDAWRTQAV